MNRIYTKTGDDGTTGLMGGKRIGKDNLQIDAYGQIDELNAALGLCRSQCTEILIEKMLCKIQHHLFSLGATLTTPAKTIVPGIGDEEIGEMEKWIDEMANTLPPLTNFILPGGSLCAAKLHLARAICRRVERSIVRLARSEEVAPNSLIYINRLSDLLFMMARFANFRTGTADEVWKK